MIRKDNNVNLSFKNDFSNRRRNQWSVLLRVDIKSPTLRVETLAKDSNKWMSCLDKYERDDLELMLIEIMNK